MKVGIIALSFGIGKDGPGLSNSDLANSIEWLLISLKKPPGGLSDVKAVFQWEIAAEINIRPHELTRTSSCLVKTVYGKAGQYLDSATVIAEAKEPLADADEIYIVAMPFLHGWLCKRLAEKACLHNVKVYKDHKINFDLRSMQWWTRGPIRLLIYSALHMIFRSSKGRSLFWDNPPEWVKQLKFEQTT